MSNSERRTNRALTVVGLMLGIAMGALEATVVATAMPTVIGDLGGISFYAWVTNAYLLSSSVTVPIYGKLADIYGRKPIMLFGIALFLLGSAASGASQTMGQLIACRALQGLGAGAMQPMALTIIGDIFNLEERSRMQGIFGAAWGFFGLTGPLIGGFIVHYVSWRWVFYINLPFGVAAATLVYTSLHERIEKKPHKLDIAGAALLTTGVAALLLATSRINETITLASAPVAIVCLVSFFLVERRAAEPILPLDVFSRRVILIPSIAGAIIGGAMVSTLTYVPLFVQGVLGGSPTQAGSAITPMMVGWPIFSAISGRLIPKLGFRPLIRTGLAITALSAITLALVENTGGGLMGVRCSTIGFGVGMGVANTALIIVVQSSVSWEQRGVVTASTMFFRTIGGMLGVGIMGGVLNASLAHDSTIPAGAASQVLSREGIHKLAPEIVARIGNALAHGLSTVFWIIAALGIAAFLTSLLFPHVPTQQKNGAPSPAPSPSH